MEKRVIDLTHKILTSDSLCGMKDCIIIVRREQLEILSNEELSNVYRESEIRKISIKLEGELR